MQQNLEPAQHEQAAISTTYYEPVAPHSSGFNPISIVLTVLAFFLLILVIMGAILDLDQTKMIGIALWQVTAIMLFLLLVGGIPLTLYMHVQHKRKLRAIELEHARENLRAKEIEVDTKEEQRLFVQEQRELARRAHEVNMYLAQTRLYADPNGNRPFIFNPSTSDVIEIASGNFPQPVPNHLHHEVNYSDTSTRALEAGKDQNSLANLHIPTFAESLASGDIGPGQHDMLFCFELLQDEATKRFTAISPIRGEIQAQHTQLVLAGSQSGKTTYMATNMAQAAVLGTLFYIIDPHKSHPEKSIAAKMAAYAPWFILPPASSHDEIKNLLKHATKVRDARIAGKPTPYDGYHIMVVIDEVPALMAHQKSSDKQLRQLYLDLAIFMQSLGIQTAKYGMTGLFASQFATKETLGEIDFRDACMSTLVMRLHPTQAQSLRILGREAVNAIPKFEKGHGFLLLADGTETRRVASSNVTQYDLNQLAALLPPSPLVKEVQKPVRNQFTRASITPIREGIETTDFESESGLKEVRNQLENQFEPAIQAKLDEMGIAEAYISLKVQRVTELLGQDKADIMRAVWGVSPNRSQAYETAKIEYALCMEIIRSQAQARIGREA